VVIIGILVALVIPEMKGTYEHAVLRSSARKLADVLSLANSQAVTANRKHIVRIDTRQRKYALEAASGNGEALRVDMPGADGEIDQNVMVNVVAREADPVDAGQPSARNGEEAGGDAISFYADGTADANDILLQDRQGFRLLLRINPI